MALVLFRSCSGCFSLSYSLGDAWGFLSGTWQGTESTLSEDVEEKLRKGLLYRGVARPREPRDSKVPRGCQQWEAKTTCGPEGSTGGSRVTGAWGQIEPPEWSLDSGSYGGGMCCLYCSTKQRENRNKDPSISLLLPPISCPSLPLTEPSWKPEARASQWYSLRKLTSSCTHTEETPGRSRDPFCQSQFFPSKSGYQHRDLSLD